MARIAILTPHLTTGDAVGNDALGMYEALSRHGFNVRLYADGWTFKRPRVRFASRIKYFLRSAHDLLIYHYSMGWDFALDLLRKIRCHTVVKYHNVTPAEYFAGLSAGEERICISGRAQLEHVVRAGCDVYLSASQYNMRELLALGAPPPRCLVVPPFHHTDRLASVEPDADVWRKYRDASTNILMVGRVTPHKGHAALIDAFALYHRDYNPGSRLLIVGKESEQLRAYSRRLRQRAARHGLGEAVVFAGAATDAQLGAYYRVADAFLLASEHEGFGVPLVEAMAMKLPIVAYGAAAVPETVGGAGLVWPERDPRLLAASLDAVVRDPRLAAGLGRMGWRRYAERFTNSRIEAQFLAAIHHLL